MVVIQCAATKRKGAGRLVSASGQRMVFVARPESAPVNIGCVYARPDDPSGNGKSWREILHEYNKRPGDNPLGLYPAYQLYENRIYERLTHAFGLENVYVLSAGWALIGAGFLTLVTTLPLAACGASLDS